MVELEDDNETKGRERRQFWLELMRDETLELKDRLRASELLGRADGDFTNKVMHQGQVETVVVVREHPGEES